MVRRTPISTPGRKKSTNHNIKKYFLMCFLKLSFHLKPLIVYFCYQTFCLLLLLKLLLKYYDDSYYFFRLNLINSAKIDTEISSGVLDEISKPTGPWILEINISSKTKVDSSIEKFIFSRNLSLGDIEKFQEKMFFVLKSFLGS